MKNSCKYNMDRGWKFVEEKYTVLPDVLSHENVYGFAKTGGARGPASDSYVDTDWEKVDLPHDWMHCKEPDRTAAADHGYRKGSVGWYRKRFYLEESDRERSLSLVFWNTMISVIKVVVIIYIANWKTFNNKCW